MKYHNTRCSGKTLGVASLIAAIGKVRFHHTIPFMTRQRCTSAATSRLPGVHRSRSVGVDSSRSLNDFRKQEWSRSCFFKGRSRSICLYKRLLCSLLIIIADCFLQSMLNITFKCAILLHRKS